MAVKTLKKSYKVMKTYQPKYTSKSFTGSYTPDTYKNSYEAGQYNESYKPTEYNDTYNPGQYQSKYMPQIEENLNKLTNWSYDPMGDANYQALAKVYGARGNLAAKNTLADAAMLNGGYGTSNAVVAAQQARNQYNQELASLIPQLEQNAYQRQQTGLGALMDIDNSQYGRFSDDQSRQLQSKQFGLDVAGYNEGNRQFAANYGLDVFNTNEGMRQFAAQLGLDYDKMNQTEKQFAADYLLDAYQANQGERQFAWNAKRANATATMDDAYQYLNYLQSKQKGSGGGGGGGGYTGGGGSADTGGSKTPTIDDARKSIILGSGKNDKNKRSAKGLTTEKEKNKKSGGRVIK